MILWFGGDHFYKVEGGGGLPPPHLQKTPDSKKRPPLTSYEGLISNNDKMVIFIFNTREFLVNRKDLQASTLVGLTKEKPVLDHNSCTTP